MGAMLITSGNLTQQSLAGQVAVVTGAGGGIGYEATRALIWLGAKIVIAEIDHRKGKEAEARLNAEFATSVAFFAPTDVGDERSIERLRREAHRRYGKVDIVINNATVAPLGAVKDVPVEDWDTSYRVNLRGPTLLARAFIPGMIERRQGVFVCVSSLGQEFMAAYEAMKAAQVHLANTLSTELEGTGVTAFTISPGYVPTETAAGSIPQLAALMGKTADELYTIVGQYQISIEAAGAGFAAAVAMAERYTGQEISSAQALLDAGIALPDENQPVAQTKLTDEQFEQALVTCRRVRSTLAEQSAGWKERSIFEQQWLIRTFKQYARMPVAEWLKALEQMENRLEAQDANGLAAIQAPLDGLASYYAHLYKMAEGYIKDPAQREAQLAIVSSWQADVSQLKEYVRGS